VRNTSPATPMAGTRPRPRRSLQDLERLKEAAWLTPEDKQALREAAEILEGASPEQVDRMHAAFTKSVMLHVTVWTRPYAGAADW